MWVKDLERFHEKMRIQRLCPVCVHNCAENITECSECALGKGNSNNTCEHWEFENKLKKE